MEGKIISGSFKDPSGFVFKFNGKIYRQINKIYKENFENLMESGLYTKLVSEDLLVPHEEVDDNFSSFQNKYKIIKPLKIPFISYPYEWCYSQLKDAAYTTIKIQKIAMDFGMSLKDCSAYNIQFFNGKCVFIDTLSFEPYIEGTPWVAYRQFCEHFLGPLALMCYKDIRLNQLFRIFPDGLPLDLVSSLLPSSTIFKFSSLSHIHLHAKGQKHFAGKQVKLSDHKISRAKLLALIASLESAVNGLRWEGTKTEWADYYNNTNYSKKSFENKKFLVGEYLTEINPRIVWDIGSNIGVFSRIASKNKILTLSLDIDPAAVEMNYLEVKRNNEKNLLPLLIDINNPSPSIGWANEEWLSFKDRGNADTIMTLALIHHLAISKNIPLEKIAKFFASLSKWLIIEFVPKDDSQVKRLLASRKDIFSDYTKENFEEKFNHYFKIKKSKIIMDSSRYLYLMERL